MKKQILLFTFILLPINIFSQDTIRNIVNGNCVNEYGVVTLTCQSGVMMQTEKDSIILFGSLGGNCGQKHLAVFTRSGFDVIVSRLDTGHMATCTCVFCFRIAIKKELNDSIVHFCDSVFKVKDLSKISFEYQNSGILVQTINDLILIMSQDLLSKIETVKIMDMKGEIIAEFKGNKSNKLLINKKLQPGIYIVQIDLGRNQIVTKKIIK